MIEYKIRIVHSIHNYSATLGRLGENKATKIIFDVSDFIKRFGDGHPEIVFQSGDGKDTHLCVSSLVGNNVEWLVTGNETRVIGKHIAELRWYSGDDELAKSTIINLTVLPGIFADPKNIPENFDDWISEKTKEIQKFIDDLIYLDNIERIFEAVDEYFVQNPPLDEDDIREVVESYKYATQSSLTNGLEEVKGLIADLSSRLDTNYITEAEADEKYLLRSDIEYLTAEDMQNLWNEV